MKIARLREMMAQLNMDAMLITSLVNVFCLSGFKGTAGSLLITEDASYLITDFRYLSQAKQQTENIEIIDVAKGEKEIFESLVKKHNIKSIGFESDYVSYSRFLKLTEYFDGLKLIAGEKIVEKIRAVKSEEEILNIKKACEIAEEAFEKVFPCIKQGVSELEIAAMLELEMKKLGAAGPSFETIVASGIRSFMPHGTASAKKLDKGDFVVIDFGAVYNGYCSDITRTVAVGDITEKQIDIYTKVQTVQEECLKLIRPGEKGMDIDRKSREMFKVWGIDEFFGHSLGHGVGAEIHELPNLSPSSAYTLHENMVVTVEPGIYIENEFGVRIEDTVLVTKEGVKRLTVSDKELRFSRG